MHTSGRPYKLVTSMAQKRAAGMAKVLNCESVRLFIDNMRNLSCVVMCHASSKRQRVGGGWEIEGERMCVRARVREGLGFRV